MNPQQVSSVISRFIALLGGINVGGHRVAMPTLRTHFEALGFTGVRTIIASGNVLFDTPRRGAGALEEEIEQQLLASLGFAVPTFIRTVTVLEEVAACEPFPDFDPTAGHTVSVIFLKRALSVDTQRALVALRTPVDELQVRGREVYWLSRGRTSDSQIDWRRTARSLQLPPMTVRNMKTVRRLLAG
jgi:uncharacterized protein (DUF1697 family)